MASIPSGMTDFLGSAADLAERLPLGLVVVGHDQRLAWANSAASRLFGLKLPIPALVDRVVEALGDGAQPLLRLAPGGKAQVLVSSRHLEVECQSHPEGRFWLISDQTLSNRLQAQLAENAGLLAFSHEAFLVVDLRGYIRYANQPCERERAYAAHALTGVHLRDLERWCSQSYEEPRQPTADEVRHRLDQVARDGGALRYHAFHLRQDGGEIPVEATIRPYRLSNEQVLLVVARDESRRLLHLQAVMAAKNEAETANRAKSAFLAITSHELRTPLTGIIGFCELLNLEIGGASAGRSAESAAEAKSAQRYLRLIHESSQSLLAIINDVVDLSKIEARTLELRSTQIDPDEIAQAAMTRWQPRAKAKGLTLIHLPDIGIGGKISADRQRLAQMLDNLLSNAVKFTDQGQICIQLLYTSDAADFAVTDTGHGVPAAAREFIFDAFWQAAHHTTRQSGGSGLGLYITRALAEMQGGRAWLERTSEQGSEFRIRLPREGTASSGRRQRIVSSDIWKASRSGMHATLNRTTTPPPTR